MSIVDRYIFRRWLGAFGIALLATLGALVLIDLSDDLPDLLAFGVSAGDILRYYLLLLPSFTPVVLPIALMLSILLSLGALNQRNEIVALRASGLSLLRITRPLWGVGVVLTHVLFFLNIEWAPWSIETARRIYDSYDFQKQLSERPEAEVGVIDNLTFANPKAGRLWFMNRFSELTFEAKGLNIYQRNEAGRVIADYTANEAYFDDYAGHWVLKQGRATRFDAQGEQIFSLPFEDVQADRQALEEELSRWDVNSDTYRKKRRVLTELNRIWEAMQELDEPPGLMRTFKKRPKDLSLRELRQVIDTFSTQESKQLNAYRARYHSLLATPVSCLIVVALAIPFAVAGVHTGAMIGVAKTLGLLLVYFFITNLALILGKNNVLEPIIAAWLPNVLMPAVTVYLYRQAR